jgi:hypothetical protein
MREEVLHQGGLALPFQSQLTPPCLHRRLPCLQRMRNGTLLGTRRASKFKSC